MVSKYDPEPERYYDWMLWKLRQERNMEKDDPIDDITEGGRLSGWTEKPYMSPQQDCRNAKIKPLSHDAY